MKFIGRNLAPFILSSLVLAGCGNPSEQDLLASAKAYREKNDVPAAIIQLKTALQKNPQSGEARYLLGDALFKNGDAAGAVAELERAHDLKHADDKVLPLLAEALIATGQAKKVTDRYSQVTVSEGNAAAELKATVATAFAAQGMLDRSEAEANAALKLNAKNVAARLLLARMKAIAGAFEEAMTLVNAVLSDEPKRREALQLKGELLRVGKGDVDGAIKAFREALVGDPRYMPAQSALISLLLQKGDVEGFKSQFAELKKALPNSLETRLYGVQLALIDKDLKRAREDVQQLLRVVPDNAIVLQLAGGVEFQNGSLLTAEGHLKKALQQAPNLVLARRLLAETYLRSGQPDKALVSLQPALDSGRPSADILVLVAEAYVQIGDAAKAETYFAQAAKANSSDPVVRTALALMQISKGNSEAGFAQLESIASVDAGTYADLALISVRLRTNDLDAALKAVDRLLAKMPGKALPHELRGRILLQRQDLAGARASFEKALVADPVYFPAVAALAGLDMVGKKPEDARKRFEAVLAREPKNPRALMAMVELRQRTGAKPEEIAALLAEAVKLNPGEAALRQALVEHQLAHRHAEAARSAAQDAVATIPDNLQLLDALGRAQLMVGDAQQAITTFKKAAALQPNLPQPQLRLADVYMAKKDYAAARQSLGRALEVSPKFLAAQRGLVKVALAEKRTDEAVKVAQSVQKERPTEAVGYLMEGEIQLSQGRWEPAITAVRSALVRERTPEIAMRLHALYVIADRPADADKFASSWQNEHPRDARFMYHLGMVAMDKKNYAAAEARFLQVLALRPEDPLVLNNLAMAMVQQGKPGAVPFAERAQKLLPQQASVMDTLASALAADNQIPKAIEWQRKAVEKAPNAAMLRLDLARLLVKAGDKSAAHAELEKLAKLGGSFPAQTEVTNLLKTL